VEAALPLALEVGLLFLSKTPNPFVAPLARQVGFEPAADLLPEGFLGGRKAKVHTIGRLANRAS
jgi:hypothetical protein